MEDGIHVHEETKTQLKLYSRENGVRRVKPFMLVVAEDTTHASSIKAIIEDPQFFGGQYKGRVIEVHSQQKGIEKDENIQALLSVEDPENPVEIVIHVNMLKEGWDVTNLYTIVPKGDSSSGYKPFTLDCKSIRLQPVSQEILIQHLQSNERFRLRSGDAVIPESKLEDYLVRGLMDFDDIDYNEISELLYSLSEQMVRHIQSYLKTEEDVLNVLQAHQQTLVKHIHAQMQSHFEETATEFDVQVSRGFVTLRPNNYSQLESQKSRHFRTTVDDKLMIRGMLFHGFEKSLYELLRFQSNTERIMAVVLEGDKSVQKWLKPAKGDFRIYYAHDDESSPTLPPRRIRCVTFVN